MKLATITNPKFMTTLQLIMDQKVDLFTAFQLKKIVNAVDNELMLYETTRQTMLMKFCELNDNGELDADEQGMVRFKSEDDKAQFQQELHDLRHKDIDIGAVSIQKLKNIELSTNDLYVLSDLITE